MGGVEMEISIQFGSFASCLGVLVNANWDELKLSGLKKEKEKQRGIGRGVYAQLVLGFIYLFLLVGSPIDNHQQS